MNDNKLIAEFMDANPFREGDDVQSYEMYGILECIEDGLNEQHFFLPEEMLFHESWDWLMPVVIKCFDADTPIALQHKLNDALLETNINTLYASVLEVAEYTSRRTEYLNVTNRES